MRANTVLFGVHGQRTWEMKNNRQDDWGGAGVGLGYQFHRRWYFMFHGLAQRVEPTTGNTLGSELQLTVRWNVWMNEPATLFLEGGAGIIGTLDPFPAHGGSFNFTEHAGLGLLVPLYDNASLTTGVRYQHLSNAGWFGDDVNPGIDGVTVFAGLLFEL